MPPQPARRDQHRDVAPEHVVGVVAEHPLRGRVPAHDAARRVDADQRIRRRVDDRAHRPVRVGARPLRARVAQQQHRAVDVAAFVEDRRRDLDDRHRFAVVHQPVLIGDRGIAAVEHAIERRHPHPPPLAVVDAQHVVHGPADRVVLRAAGQRLRPRVDERDPALQVARQHALRERLQHGLVLPARDRLAAQVRAVDEPRAAQHRRDRTGEHAGQHEGAEPDEPFRQRLRIGGRIGQEQRPRERAAGGRRGEPQRKRRCPRHAREDRVVQQQRQVHAAEADRERLQHRRDRDQRDRDRDAPQKSCTVCHRVASHRRASARRYATCAHA
ncbi:hypothetical protein BST28156_06762 [Burkholderia stagnalis]|nr:hypothetical protein BST28156_06762 [Burkholderia stagnalis]